MGNVIRSGGEGKAVKGRGVEVEGNDWESGKARDKRREGEAKMEQKAYSLQYVLRLGNLLVLLYILFV